MFALIAFVGGLSAATAMVIVECVALAMMISNDLATPLILRHGGPERADMGGLLLTVRRLSIFAILLLAYAYYRFAGEAALASIGFLAFAAIAQFAPAFFGGLFWKRATSRGAAAGMVAGLAVWAYCLLLPSLADSAVVCVRDLIEAGPFGLAALKPTALLRPRAAAPDPWRRVEPRPQHRDLRHRLADPRCPARSNASRPMPSSPATTPCPGQGFALWRSAVTVEELRATVVALSRRGAHHALLRGLRRLARTRLVDPSAEADVHVVRFAEHLLASAIGAASSRLVLSLMLRRRNLSTKAALQLLDDASAAIQYSRDLLQTALDNARQGVSVFDKDLRLQAWNRAFRDLWDLPPAMMRVGVGLDEIIRHAAERGTYGPGDRRGPRCGSGCGTM